MRKLFSILICLLLIPSIGLCWGSKKKQYNELQKVAGEINEALPQMVSKEIQLVRVVAQEYNEIEYVMKTLLYSINDLNINSIERTLKPQTKNSICSSPDTLEMIKHGVTYTYVYYDKNNIYIGKFSVTPNDCGY
ncbi:MAG: hypothetical protein HQK78_17700 [Desulfobacterales bacterium]|nr:hypothetical protein [Desulfobacterales bacterium]